MIAIHIFKYPEIVHLAQKYFHLKSEDRVELYEDIATEHLQELYAKNRRMPWQGKMIVSAFERSSILSQLAILQEYPMDIEVCVPIFTRIHSSWDGKCSCKGSFDHSNILNDDYVDNKGYVCLKFIKYNIGQSHPQALIDAVHATAPKSDMHTGEIAETVAQKTGCHCIIATVSREIADLNRPEDSHNLQALNEYRKSLSKLLTAANLLSVDQQLHTPLPRPLSYKERGERIATFRHPPRLVGEGD